MQPMPPESVPLLERPVFTVEILDPHVAFEGEPDLVAAAAPSWIWGLGWINASVAWGSFIKNMALVDYDNLSRDDRINLADAGADFGAAVLSTLALWRKHPATWIVATA